MDVVFVRTRWDYQSYTDFWKLVELSGYETVYVDEMEVRNPNIIYIVCPMNGEWRPYIDSHLGLLHQTPHDVRAKFVLWNLERPGGSGSVGRYKLDNWGLLSRYVDHVVVSDRALATYCGFDYMPVGIHPELGHPGSVKTYDVIHLSCYSSQRSWLFDAPDRPKAMLKGGLFVAPNGWDDERGLRLHTSKFMLSIHQDVYKYIEPLRYALAAAYGLPIFTDGWLDCYPYDEYVMQYDHKTLVDWCDNYYTKDLHRIGERMRSYMLGQFQFRQCVDWYAQYLEATYNENTRSVG